MNNKQKANFHTKPNTGDKPVVNSIQKDELRPRASFFIPESTRHQEKNATQIEAGYPLALEFLIRKSCPRSHYDHQRIIRLKEIRKTISQDTVFLNQARPAPQNEKIDYLSEFKAEREREIKITSPGQSNKFIKRKE